MMNLTIKVVKLRSGKSVYITRNGKVFTVTKDEDGNLHIKSTRDSGHKAESETVSISLSKEETDIIRKYLGD